MDDGAHDIKKADPRLGDHLKALGRGAQNAYGRVVDAAVPPVERIAETTKAQPLASLAMAAVAGAAIATLKGGRRRRWR